VKGAEGIQSNQQTSGAVVLSNDLAVSSPYPSHNLGLPYRC